MPHKLLNTDVVLYVFLDTHASCIIFTDFEFFWICLHILMLITPFFLSPGSKNKNLKINVSMEITGLFL